MHSRFQWLYLKKNSEEILIALTLFSFVSNKSAVAEEMLCLANIKCHRTDQPHPHCPAVVGSAQPSYRRTQLPACGEEAWEGKLQSSIDDVALSFHVDAAENTAYSFNEDMTVN